MEKQSVFYATGKRKSAVARTWLKPGTGKIVVNNMPMDEYFKVKSARAALLSPLSLTNTLASYDITANVSGGGISGQAGAIRHGITRALILASIETRPTLKKIGFVRRDPRIKERKKYGQRSARARFQFSKR
jgi:small subunit ribosomal protein S9